MQDEADSELSAGPMHFFAKPDLSEIAFMWAKRANPGFAVD